MTSVSTPRIRRLTQKALVRGVPVSVVPFGRDQLEKVERAFRRQDRPARRPPRTEPITKGQLREWSLMKPHAVPFDDYDAD